MYMKLPPEDLNPNLCPLHHISVYTCEVTITPWCAVVNKKEKKKKILNLLFCVFTSWSGLVWVNPQPTIALTFGWTVGSRVGYRVKMIN